MPRVALIAGPTASGKSALAVALAQATGGIVINADASQVYADLRLLSARPSVEEEAAAPHRLFGHVDGADTGYSAARWAGEARQAIGEALAGGRLPILVGGTGLYLRTLVQGIAPVPEIAPDVRAAVRAMPVEAAHAALGKEDPDAAVRLNPADTTRVARALEVVRSTSRTLADWQKARTGGIGDSHRIVATILLPDRAWLRARIDRRLEAMVELGALDEVAALLARADVPPDAVVRRAIGVPELGAHLAGTLPLSDAVARAQAASRQYAKRQYTFFRHQFPPDWPRTIETETSALLADIERRLRV